MFCIRSLISSSFLAAQTVVFTFGQIVQPGDATHRSQIASDLSGIDGLYDDQNSLIAIQNRR
ncbi:MULTISPECIES: hypothetical protein [unclassified Spirosoma]|uniref:hypothetical protein n=1 Tax=unclassified Spirosoma TaxID=2621999 RepID=UPI0009626273|nr:MULTISPECIES: hypothetical protein [unclassified Spirosoma]MBN8823483.1 hypothetical protein [Spirosoma sp.]OJW71908.1 MAG: hypothetical protein BGO59_16830 [Spirosoma sp. 48-14]